MSEPNVLRMLVAELGSTPKIDAAGHVAYEELRGWRERIARVARFAKELPTPPTAAEREVLRLGGRSFDEILRRTSGRRTDQPAEPADKLGTDFDAILRRRGAPVGDDHA